ncbi:MULTISPECIES: fibronectin type III domain-containing protein [Paenibacillus]|uniref:fibronectin type III domain-containing protein n=1 Tax=Paenibacillus TaxID=44249 RepID=UPI0022B8A434|nr:fibronectin type III domain-containing protein [Paenibacillus caseinilyticus]MCZ8521201.1 fibronectin type III domain-containing protein [Paenibacillus caseinilyticus]
MTRQRTKPKALILTLIAVLFLSLLPLYPSQSLGAAAPWQAGTAYKAGDQVTYSAKTYQCLQPHTALQGWEPPNVPSLWKEAAGGGTGSDTAAPSVPANVAVMSKTSTSVTLTWNASTDNTGVTQYEVYRGTALAASVTGTTATVSGLTASTAYTFTVKAKDAAGNVSAASSAVSVTTSAPAPADTAAPTVPGGLKVTGVTSSSVSLSWSASTDNVGVTQYEVYRGTMLAATVTGTEATVSGLTASTAYTFAVKAKDAAGNASAASASVSATTDKAGTTPAGGRKYVAYASTWNTSIYDLKPENIPNYITNVNLSFARPDTAYVKGSYQFDQAVAGFEFFEGAATNAGQKKFTAQQSQDLRSAIAALKARGTEVWVSVGGWSYSQGDQWSRFSAPHVVDLALDLGASGVDIDWESSSSVCNKGTEATFSCTKDAEISGIISTLHSEIASRQAGLKISIAGWSTGAYYVKGTPFEEGKVQWGSPFGGTMYTVVKNQGSKIDMINLMSYDAGDYFDARESYEAYRAIYGGILNMGMQVAPEGAGGAVLEVEAPAGTVYDADMMTGQNNMATSYYNVETMVKYIKNKGKATDGFMLWQLWKQRVHQPAPAGAATENSAGQYVCRNLPLAGDCSQSIPVLPKLNP